MVRNQTYNGFFDIFANVSTMNTNITVTHTFGASVVIL